MKTIPFIAPYFKANAIPRYSDEMCGGDCFKFVKKHLNIKWLNSY